MDTNLWNKIRDFDLDQPLSEYGFSLRLARENYWTAEFTRKAVIEYKKFMYLAAISDAMVSPSKIVDTVWHQHLTFTQSYNEFCGILGRQVQHIPSNRGADDRQKFQQAKTRTNELYKTEFGDAPDDIWKYQGMYESLNLPKAKYKLRSFIILGMLGFAVLSVPAFFILRGFYIGINNPVFLFFFAGIVIVTFFWLEFSNRAALKRIVSQFDKSSFVFELRAKELIYLKTRNIEDAIHAVMNKMFVDKKILIDDTSIEMNPGSEASNLEEWTVLDTLDKLKKVRYSKVLTKLKTKPVFFNIRNTVDALQKYFNKSKAFADIFYTNFFVLAGVVMLGFIRLLTGLTRGRPIELIAILLIIVVGIVIFFLMHLSSQFSKQTIPDLYRKNILPVRKEQQNYEWDYFLMGDQVLAREFILVKGTSDIDTSSSSGGSDSSGSSDSGGSCGSSCGSSCGGCGGGD
ncbi:hypothetical protein WSM22_03700 [Cytophagales bacterium WSM2-2]|nr:hypothetical protein WSM22_03700 [Cytophagales bacterium WSM2-2]